MRAKRSSAETRPNELSEHRRLVLWQECNHTTGAAPHRLLVVIKRVRVRPSAQYVCQSALHMCEAAGGSDRVRKYTDRTHSYAFASTQESEDNANCTSTEVGCERTTGGMHCSAVRLVIPQSWPVAHREGTRILSK